MSTAPVNTVPNYTAQGFTLGVTGDNGITSASADFAYMTPDTLMTYCESRLKGIDTQVKEQFAKQQSANKESTALTALMQALAGAGGASINDARTDTAGTNIKAAFVHALDASVGDPATFAAVKAEYSKFLATAYEDDDSPYKVPKADSKDTCSTIDDKELQDMSANIKDAQSNLNSGSELAMIQLQQLMSQRQTAISTCTNLISTLNQASTGIAQNLKA